MRIIDGLNYREWQRRNTQFFSQLNSAQQKELRLQGYRNVGWLNVQRSWKVLKKITEAPDLFQHRLDNHDLLGAIRHAILESERTKQFAQESLEKVEENYQKIHQIATETLAKYQLL